MQLHRQVLVSIKQCNEPACFPMHLGARAQHLEHIEHVAIFAQEDMRPEIDCIARRRIGAAARSSAQHIAAFEDRNADAGILESERTRNTRKSAADDCYIDLMGS